MYTTLVVLHIFCAACWIGVGVFAFFMMRHLKTVRGTAAELHAMHTLGAVGKPFGMIGSIGILVTGVLTTLAGGYGFFPFASLPWLALKQTNYLLIMTLFGSLFVPAANRLEARLKVELSGDTALGASTELRGLVSRLLTIGFAIQGLILLNVILGESKALMWVGAN